MLCRVLIVDDEVLARNHLRSIIRWERHGYTVCGEAENGEDAVNMIRELQADIVMIDIHMAHMDGVDLSRYIHDHFKHVKMIMISSYDAYDFVRESLNNGAVDYLLKHRLNAGDLLRVLDKARQQLLQEAKQKEEQAHLARKWEMASPVVARNFLKELILGEKPDDERIRADFKETALGSDNANWMLILTQILHLDLVTAKYTDTEVGLYHRSVLDLCQQAIGDYKSGFASYMEKGRYVLFLSFGQLRSEHEKIQQVQALIRKIEKSLKLFMDATAVSVHGTPFYKLEDIAESYQTLMVKMDEIIGAGTPERSANDWGEAADVTITVREEKGLLSSMEMSDSDGMLQVLEQIFSKLRQADYYAKMRVMTELLHIAVKIAHKSGMDTDWIYTHILSLQQQSLEFGEMNRLIRQVYERIVGDMRSKRLGYSPYVELAVQWIKSRYKQGISLEEAAEAIGITPPYLSRLFKEETGMTFTESINAYRIEISKRLIENGEAKMKELYKEVGFNHYSYFIKVFKELTGETPNSYARKLKGTKSAKI